MAYNSAHTGPQIDAAVELLGQIQSARDATAADRDEVAFLASQVDDNADQVATQAATVSTQTAQVLASAAEVDQAHDETLSASALAVDAKDAAALSAVSAQQSKDSATASASAAAQSQVEAGLSEQISAENAESSSADRLVVEALAQQVEADSVSAQINADSAALSALNAAAVVTGGTATIAPAPGKIPLADAQGKVDSGWIGEDIARVDAVQAAKELANEGLEAIAAIKDPTDPTKGAAEVGYDGGTAQNILDYAKPLANYAALRAYSGRASGVRITQSGIAGFFQRLATGSYTDDGGLTIVDALGRGWRRLIGGVVDVAWYEADATGVANSAPAFSAAYAYALAKKLKLVAYGLFRLSADVSLRFIGFDLSASDIVVDAGFTLTIGGDAGQLKNPRQILGDVRRSTYNFDTTTYTTPTVRCMGAKGQLIDAGFIEYLQFYQSTNPATFPADASQAYSTFNFNFVMKLEVTTDPAYAGGPAVDGPGSANQWFNTNQINFGRCIWFLMQGSYLHNHNHIQGGTFEQAGSRIDVLSGNKNVFEHVRAEGNNLTISFSTNCTGNDVELDWFSSVPNAFTLPIVSDLGTMNTVRTAIDVRHKFIEVLRATPNDLVFDTSVTPFANREPNLAFIRGTAAFAVLASSDRFEIAKGDYIYPTANAFTFSQQGVYNIKLFFYDKKGNPISPSTTFAIGSATQTVQGMALQSRFTSPSSATAVPAWIAIQDAAITAGVAMMRVEVIASSVIAEGIATDILVNRMTKDLSYSLPKAASLTRLPVVSAVPTKGYAEIGTVAMKADGTQEYRVRFAIDTFTTASAAIGSSTIVVNDITRSGIGTIVAGSIAGISDDANNSEWPAVVSVDVGTKTITLSAPLAAALPANSRVVFIRWQTV